MSGVRRKDEKPQVPNHAFGQMESREHGSKRANA